MVYILRFFSSKCSSFHNSNVFGPCIIHILYTECAKNKKNNSGAKRLMIVTPMKILQQNLNRSRFVVWEIKRNMSVVRFKFRCNILISGKIIKEMPGSVASWTHCIIVCTTCRTIQEVCILLTKRIYSCHMIVTINGKYLPTQHQLTGLCNGEYELFALQ